MKKIIVSLGLISLMTVGASANIFSNTFISTSFLSVENGGTKSAIDSYQDGVGVFVVSSSNSTKIDNSSMNNSVYKYGIDAKTADKSLTEYMNMNGINTDNLAVIKTNILQIGTTCDDGNIETTNDIIIDNTGTCKGSSIALSKIFINSNGSVDCSTAEIGTEEVLNGVSYLVVNEVSLNMFAFRAETLCVSNVKDMSHMFAMSNFNGNISKWDVSNVKDMNHMFTMSNFNGDISKWDVSNVDDMSNMFTASDFNKNISNWNVSNVVNFFAFSTNSPLTISNTPIFNH